MKGGQGKPPLYETAEELAQKIKEYFDTCVDTPVMRKQDGKEVALLDSKGQPVFRHVVPTTAGLAYFLGYASRQSLYDQTKRKDDPDSFSYVIKRALLMIESHHEGNLSSSGAPVGSIFWLKVHKWLDRPEPERGDNTAPPIRILFSGKPNPADLDPEANDNLEISSPKPEGPNGD